MTTQTLVLGGARSGKSRHAENLASASNKEVLYIATANIFDDEVQQRVERHKQDRPASWVTVEEPILLAETLLKWASPERVILVDCLTMWVMNLLSHDDKSLLKKELKLLHDSTPKLTGDVIFVSNEVGMGIIPMGELTREFVDESGRLHQQLAQQVNDVILMVAGLPHTIKQG